MADRQHTLTLKVTFAVDITRADAARMVMDSLENDYAMPILAAEVVEDDDA
jgi:hypothetical protein